MLTYLYLYLKNLLAGNEKGQDVVEYAVLVVFIAILVIVGITAFGNQMKSIYSQIAAAVDSGI